MKFCNKLLLLVIPILLTGCASILNRDKGPNMLTTEPSGAEVYDGNNIKVGTTPLDLNKLPSATRQLKIRHAGYRDADLMVSKKSRNGILFLDAMLLCIPCPVDLAGDNVSYFTPKAPFIKLRKEAREKDNPLKIAVDKVLMKTSGNSLGKLNGRNVSTQDAKFMRMVGSIEDGDDAIKQALNSSYFEAHFLATVNNMKSSLAKPKVLVRPVIKNLKFDVKGKTYTDYKGLQEISVDWNISRMSDKDNVLATFTTHTTVNRVSGSTNKLIDPLMYEASLDFMENDSIYNFIKKAELDYLATSKGDEIKLSSGQTGKYNSVKDAMKELKTAVITVVGKEGFGSGFIITSDGYIITNYHVISKEKSVSVRLSGSLKMNATVVKTNADYDLALLKIEAEDLKSIPAGNSDEVSAGEDVYAIGTPMDESFGQSITRGIISGERTISGIKFLQTDVSINSGNSGGPLINDKGEWIGITTMKLRGEGVEGIGFCIPSNTAIEMLNIKF